jgi:plasmid maintenance system antidote protein VapI
LARLFGGDAQSWLNLQSAYDLRITEISRAAEVREDVKPYKA